MDVTFVCTKRTSLSGSATNVTLADQRLAQKIGLAQVPAVAALLVGWLGVVDGEVLGAVLDVPDDDPPVLLPPDDPTWTGRHLGEVGAKDEHQRGADRVVEPHLRAGRGSQRPRLLRLTGGVTHHGAGDVVPVRVRRGADDEALLLQLRATSVPARPLRVVPFSTVTLISDGGTVSGWALLLGCGDVLLDADSPFSGASIASILSFSSTCTAPSGGICHRPPMRTPPSAGRGVAGRQRLEVDLGRVETVQPLAELGQVGERGAVREGQRPAQGVGQGNDLGRIEQRAALGRLAQQRSQEDLLALDPVDVAVG